MALLVPPLLGAKAPFPNQDIHELFLDVAAGIPSASAVSSERLDDIHKVVDGDGVDPTTPYHLTYGELQERVLALSAELRRRQPSLQHGLALVAVCLQRTPALAVALLGTLAAGAAYVPLEPTHPGARLQLLLEDSQVGLLVTCWCARRRGLLPDEQLVRVTAIDGRLIPSSESGGGAAGDAAPHPDSSAGGLLDRPAYLLYTSGSTGKPKGVLVPRRGVLNVLHTFYGLLTNARGGRAPDTECTLLAVTTYCFDISVLEIFLPLVFGFQLYLASAATARNGPKLRALLEDLGALILQGTPATWRSLIHAGWSGGTDLLGICGGEVFPPALALSLLERVSAGLWNAYGPTEATIWATAHHLSVQSASPGPVPIGGPLPNVELLILAAPDAEDDSAGREEGVGELCIGGAGVALGYHRRPELTASHFVNRPAAAPASTVNGCSALLYRTGDLVRPLSNDELEFIGRADQQVKIRGFRVELGEVEAALERHPAVQSAAAALGRRKLFSGQDDDIPSLLAFIVPCSRGSEAVADRHARFAATEPGLRSYLAATLPAYMVPHKIHFLAALPLSPAGKVDRRQLLEDHQPDAGMVVSIERERQSLPQDEGEVAATAALDEGALRRRVVKVIRSTTGLGGADVGLDVPLAELGIDSVSAAPLAQALGDEILGGKAEVPLDLLLSDGSLATLLEQLGTS